jgi:hypothetical protein
MEVRLIQNSISEFMRRRRNDVVHFEFIDFRNDRFGLNFSKRGMDGWKQIHTGLKIIT